VINKQAVKPAEAADILGISRRLLLRLVASGEIPAIRFGPRSLRIPLGGLRDWLQGRSQQETQLRAERGGSGRLA
jgi:excisionase family DNA binding protein